MDVGVYLHHHTMTKSYFYLAFLNFLFFSLAKAAVVSKRQASAADAVYQYNPLRENPDYCIGKEDLEFQTPLMRFLFFTPKVFRSLTPPTQGKFSKRGHCNKSHGMWTEIFLILRMLSIGSVY
jgi:hypothetical protein